MLRRLFGKTSTNLLYSARSTHIKKLLCLTESVNPNSQEITNAFQNLASKTNLSSEKLISLIGLLNINLQTYRNMLNSSQYGYVLEDLENQYRSSPYYSNHENLEQRQKTLHQQYPEVVNYILNESNDRKSLLSGLYACTLTKSGTISPKEFLEKFLVYENIIMSQISEIKNDKLLEEFKKTFREIARSAIQNYPKLVADIHSLYNSYHSQKQLLGKEKEDVKKIEDFYKTEAKKLK